jgi:hypothetical protein
VTVDIPVAPNGKGNGNGNGQSAAPDNGHGD